THTEKHSARRAALGFRGDETVRPAAPIGYAACPFTGRRRAGIRIADRADALKRAAIRTALGLRGDGAAHSAPIVHATRPLTGRRRAGIRITDRADALKRAA